MQRPLVSFLGLALAGLAPLAPAADPVDAYEAVLLGSLGNTSSAAFGLNDLGQVVGWSEIPGCTTSTGLPCRRAFLWQNGQMTDLGLMPGDEGSFARAINNSGLIVGTSEFGVLFGSGTFHGVTWNATPGPKALPDLGLGLAESIPHDVNEAGLIAGHAVDPVLLRDRAVTWLDGAITNIGLGEEHSYNRAYGVSDTGFAAGFAWDLFSPNDAIAWNGSFWNTIGGKLQFQNSEARDINSDGLTVGLQAFPSGPWHAALWNPATGLEIDAGTVAGFDTAELYDVNEAGQAVGGSYPGDQSAPGRAIFWDGSTLHDLNDLLVGSSMHLLEAREINELGEIAGTALVDGALQAVLLRPAPAPPVWTDLGFQLAGPTSSPELEGLGTLEGGTQVTLQIRKAISNGTALLGVGFTQLNFDLGFGVLVPSPDLVVGGIALDAGGAADLLVDWPIGVASGLSLYLQAWIPDLAAPSGLTATNGLQATTP